MILNKIDDPRSPIHKARRPELAAFAKAHGISEFTFNGVHFPSVDEAPAMVTREYLISRGLTRIQLPPRPLGTTHNRLGARNHAPPQETVAAGSGVEVGAASDLARQFAQQPAPPPPPPPAPAKPGKFVRLKPRPPQAINLLRDECKKLGIKMQRRDGMASLKAKIEAHKAQNGKDPAQRSQ